MSNQEFIDYILSPKAIRAQANNILALAESGKTNFSVDRSKIDGLSSFVVEVIKDNYPDLNIPFHSRWGHFKVGGIDRVENIDAQIKLHDKLEQSRILLDLVITSVLLDAGAGPNWKYFEKDSEKTFSRSEGLGVASFYMFLEGSFSNETSSLLRADGKGLVGITNQDLEKSFQVSVENPLVGVEGRVSLLNQLGSVVSSKKDFFKDSRPGNILDYIIGKHGMKCKAEDVLNAVLIGFGDIWPGRVSKDGVNLGDVWKYSHLEELEGLVPFHKLSQWLTYSLIGPIEKAGVEVTDVHHLTGLAEYRNGGLFVDYGVLDLRDKSLYDKAHAPSSDLIIEWRALTIALLDEVALKVRTNLNLKESEFPLAKVLEGGTWWAGRRLATKNRSDGSPPIKLDSDGTVF